MHVRLGFAALLTAATVALVATPASAAASLGGFWHLDEPKGTVAADDSSNANHGTIDGAARIKARFSRGLSFDGVDDRVVIPRSSSLEPATVTIEAWVRAPASPGVFRYIIANSAKGCDFPSYGLYTGSNGGVAFAVSGQDFDPSAISPAAAPEAIWNGAWHHIAGTFDGATIRMYVDGVEVGSGTPRADPILYGLPDSTNTQFGMFGGTCSLPYAGDLDEPRVWGRAMSATEIAASAAMGGSSTTTLDEFTDAGQSVAYTKSFSNGNVTISTESATGTEQIVAVRLRGLLPLTSLATCRNDLSALLNSFCDITLSNDGRTASLKVRRILFSATVTLRVYLASGRTFDVTAQTP